MIPIKTRYYILALFLIPYVFSCAGTSGPGSSKQSWTLTFKDGTQKTGMIGGYDDRKTEFKFESGGKSSSFLVGDLQAIQAAGAAAAAPASATEAPDNTDLIEQGDGTVIHGIFWNWSSRDIAYRIPEEGERGKGVPLANLRRIVFGKRVFAAERINWKKGMNFYSVEEEVSMGNQFADQIQYEEFIVEDPVIKTYIQNLGNRLAAHSFRNNITYTFNVINSDQVNAFAVPGGHVYVYRGLVELSENESELAGVIGHEIGHIAGYHSAQQLSKTTLMQGLVQGVGLLAGLKNEKWGTLIQTFGGISAYFMQMKFSRDDERESDYMGVYTLYKAGYQPSGMMTFFQKMQQQSGGSESGKFASLFQSHPLTGERIQNTQLEIQKMPSDASLRQSSPAFDAFKDKVGKLPKPFLAAKNAGQNLAIKSFQFQPSQSLGAAGKGPVTIRNTSEYAMGNIELQLHYKNSRGAEIGSYAFGISGGLEPGESTTVDVYTIIAKTAPQGTARMDVTVAKAVPVPKIKPEVKNQPRQLLLLEQ